MKLYREPVIMSAALLVSVIVFGCSLIQSKTDTSATVDGQVPVPLQIGTKANPVYTKPAPAKANSSKTSSLLKKPLAASASSKSSSSMTNPNSKGKK